MPSLNWERDEDYDDDDCANSHVAQYDTEDGDEYVLSVWSDPSGSDWAYALECLEDDGEGPDKSEDGFKSLDDAKQAAESALDDFLNE